MSLRLDYCLGGGGKGEGCPAGGGGGGEAGARCGRGLGLINGGLLRGGGAAGCRTTATGLGANVGGGFSKNE